MNEKAYKVTGVAAGIISIVSGAKLLKDKKGLTF